MATNTTTQPFGGSGAVFNPANPMPNASAAIGGAMTSLYGGGISPTSYASTGLLPNTAPTTTSKPMAVVTSEQAKNVSNTQQSVINDVNNTIAQTQTTRAANPQVSIVDALNAKGQASDFGSRAKMAASIGMTNYTGTAEQNMQLIQALNNPQPKAGATTTTAQPNASQTTQQPATNVGKTVTNPNTGTQTTIQNVGQNPDGSFTVTLADTPNSIRMDANTYNAMISGTGSNPQYQGQTGGVLSPFQQQTLNQWQNAYDNYNNTIQQIFNGTFLTPDQQAQIAATQATFDRIRSLQTVANQNYEKYREQASFRGGQNVTDPNQFLAQKQQVIQSGLDKIAAVDAAATKALSELKQSFMDKNYKMANDAYTALRGYLKDKNDLIQKAVDDARTMETDLRDYNFEVQKHADEIDMHNEDKISAIQATAGENGAPLDVLEAIGNAPDQMTAMALAGKYLSNPLENAYKQAQIDKIYNDIKTSGVGGMGVDPGLYIAYAQQYATNGQIPPGLPKGTFGVVAQVAKELPKQKGQIVSTATGVYPAGGQTAFIDGLSGMASVVQLTNRLKELDNNRIGGVIAGTVGKLAGSDAQGDYVELRSQIMGLLAQARSGLAVTDKEYQRYEKMLPTRFSEKFFLGRDSQDMIENFQKTITDDLTQKAAAKGYSVYGISKIKMPDNNEYTVGDIIQREDGVHGRINADGSVTLLNE